MKEEPKVEEKKPVPAAGGLAAMLAAKAKASKGKKGAKGKKGPAQKAAAPAKKETTVEKAKEPEPAVEMTKEERNAADRIQMITFIKELRIIKEIHISTCLDVLRQINIGDKAGRFSVQDYILDATITPLLKLLYLRTSRFCAQFFL